MRFLALLYRGPLIKIVKCILFKQKLASLIPGGKGIYENLDQSIFVMYITTFETSVFWHFFVSSLKVAYLNLNGDQVFNIYFFLIHRKFNQELLSYYNITGCILSNKA